MFENNKLINTRVKKNLKELETNMASMNARMKNFWKKIHRFNQKHPHLKISKRKKKIVKNLTLTKEDPGKFLNVLGKMPN